ncbi:response regulator [Lysobacter sp. KIS68-7]|uniref:response regulator n=1 Tax=Lysobacter sp. KIS68-7 TaxID=2904252 RepID=UPI001E390978|nr:response regulator [Lysobacter sp. KIS68-7]UHQ20502.1 response regulator [Lysobacter sp. KIS68-7]
MSTTQASAAARVLVIDDEPQIRRFLEIALRAQGYMVAVAETAQAGLEALALQGSEVVILDLGLPDRDGLDALRDLREWSRVPVLVLTVRADEAEKVAALDAGADDYVTKPFGVQELLARLRVLLRARNTPGDAPAMFDDGRLRVDIARRIVTLDGEALVLSRKEFALLALLVRHAGQVVTQPQLLRELWGPTHQQDTHYVRILVAKLRQKLGDDAASPKWIATEPGVGLRFLADA